jgi:hypothetical protein
VVCSRHFDSVNKGTSSDNTKLWKSMIDEVIGVGWTYR